MVECRALSRRAFFLKSGQGMALGLAVIATTAWVDRLTKIYVASDGDDSNSGLRPDQAWRTISRVNQGMREGLVGYGSRILFRRGDEFFGHIEVRPQHGAGLLEQMEISSYGKGRRPIISGYKVVKGPDVWQAVGNDIWRINLVDQTSYRGNLMNSTSNTGFILVDGRIYGAKKWSRDRLNRQWDFYDDDHHLYVKSTANPSELAQDLRIAVDGVLIKGYSGLVVEGLELVGVGGHGYRQTDATNVVIKNCKIHQIGGARLKQRTRYGNGVELWLGSRDTLVTDNEISDVYDAAYTMQGKQKESFEAVARCHFRSNRIWNTTQAFEYWGTGSNGSADSGFIDCSFSDNICINGGLSWGYEVRPDQVGRGNFLQAYSQELPVDISVTGNTFFNARDCYLFVNTNGDRLRRGYFCDDNVIALRPDTRIQFGTPFTVEKAATWSASTGLDRNSRWLTVPSSIESRNDAIRYVDENLDSLRPR